MTITAEVLAELRGQREAAPVANQARDYRAVAETYDRTAEALQRLMNMLLGPGDPLAGGDPQVLRSLLIHVVNDARAYNRDAAIEYRRWAAPAA